MNGEEESTQLSEVLRYAQLFNPVTDADPSLRPKVEIIPAPTEFDRIQNQTDLELQGRIPNPLVELLQLQGLRWYGLQLPEGIGKHFSVFWGQTEDKPRGEINNAAAAIVIQPGISTPRLTLGGVVPLSSTDHRILGLSYPPPPFKLSDLLFSFSEEELPAPPETDSSRLGPYGMDYSLGTRKLTMVTNYGYLITPEMRRRAGDPQRVMVISERNGVLGFQETSGIIRALGFNLKIQEGGLTVSYDPARVQKEHLPEGVSPKATQSWSFTIPMSLK